MAALAVWPVVVVSESLVTLQLTIEYTYVQPVG